METEMDPSASEPSTSDGQADTSGSSDGQCGNGIIESAEECDDAGESAECNANCTTSICGDGIANAAAGEQCDGTEFLGVSCEAAGYAAGRLSCDARCGLAYDTCSILRLSAVKRFDFAWPPQDGASHYRLFERRDADQPLDLIADDITDEFFSIERALHLHQHATYHLEWCDGAGACTGSHTAEADDSIAGAVGYFKASNTDADDLFSIVALSGDGKTLAVGAYNEASNTTTGINGDGTNDDLFRAGAVYVYTQDDMGTWSQQAYVKAEAPEDRLFGTSVALSEDGDILAVGAPGEDSEDGVSGDAGAVYIFVRDMDDEWSQRDHLTASNASAGDYFGSSVALSSDGSTLAVGAFYEGSALSGINTSGDDNSAFRAGAVYVFTRDGVGQWEQQAYIKASNVDERDQFGSSVALSQHGDTLAVGAYSEDSSSPGDEDNNDMDNAGAAYIFVRDDMDQWTQQAYIKASSPAAEAKFGEGVALSNSGDLLAVSAGGTTTVYSRTMGQWSYQDIGQGAGTKTALSRDGRVLAAVTLANDGVDIYEQEIGTWSLRGHVEAPNADPGDWFGYTIALNADGSTLAISAWLEDSRATGIGGDQFDNSAIRAGAVYLY